MTNTPDDSPDRRSPLDADLVDNLDALTRDLDDIDALAAAALSGQAVDGLTRQRLSDAPAGLTYDELTAHHRQRRDGEKWGEADLADILDPAALAQLDAWRAHERLPWDRADLLAVGCAGLIGALANVYDTQLDGVVLDGLAWLKKSDLLRQWERDAARLAIDYTGPHFGGPAHRVRSAGHDIGRFFTALEQVRTGTFEGTRWEDRQRIVETVTTTRSGLAFKSSPDPYIALTLLLKHWAADFVTPMSLPLPGWSLLYEMPDRDLRTFAHKACAQTNKGDGLNLRSGVLSPGLGVFATEVLIRTHTHLTSYRETGNPLLTTAQRAKQTEMLLAAHTVAGAISLSKTVAAAMAGNTVGAVRHLNTPLLLTTGRLAAQVQRDARSRAQQGAQSWEELLEAEAKTWTLPEAGQLVDLLVV